MSIITADPNLYARFEAFAFGDAIVGLGYDLNGNGFSLSDGTAFDASGISFAGRSDGATANDPGDHYAEGWDTGFWAYWLGNGDPFAGGSWESAFIGLSDRTLAHGDWDGLRFAPGFFGESPREPVAAVPAPAVAFMLTPMLLSLCRRALSPHARFTSIAAISFARAAGRCPPALGRGDRAQEEHHQRFDQARGFLRPGLVGVLTERAPRAGDAPGTPREPDRPHR